MLVFAVAERLYCVTAARLFARSPLVMHLSAASRQLCGLCVGEVDSSFFF